MITRQGAIISDFQSYLSGTQDEVQKYNKKTQDEVQKCNKR